MNVNEMMTSHDFSEWHTGGGCTAYAHTLENGDYVLITNEDAQSPNDASEKCLVGLYNENGDELAFWDAENVAHALHLAQWAVIEFYAD